jgi:hypothetical protein
MKLSCQHCDHRHPASEKRNSYRWLCCKFPRQPMADEIDWSQDGRHGTWNGFDPFHLCEQVQKLYNWNCPHFTIKPDPEKGK